MKLFMLNHCQKNGITLQDFFRFAHIWRFGKDADMSNHIAQFLMHAIVPPFAQLYVHHIEESQKCFVPVATEISAVNVSSDSEDH